MGDRLSTWLDPDGQALAGRLVKLAVDGLPVMFRADSQEFAFTRALGAEQRLELRGHSLRYAAIVALGAHFLDEATQRSVFGGRDREEYVTVLTQQAAGSDNLGDLALVTWAAAQSGHPCLDTALKLLRERDTDQRPEYVVEAAWVLAALCAAREGADVSAWLRRSRSRLLDALAPGSPIFPHATAAGLVRSYRDHVGCFADQVYPIQALARLHHALGDEEALAAADACAARICQLQGEAGQWWWHYDSRRGSLVEGYPVYTVHQHAMAPMALIDLAEAGGTAFRAEIGQGLSWLENPPELAGNEESMIRDADKVTWRKVFRGDPRKIVRGLQTVTTRAVPGLRMPGVDAVFPPRAIDRECRPYEFGWLLFTWLGSLGGRPAPGTGDATVAAG